MKISYNWLKEYLPIDETPERIAELLTATGLEVEAIEQCESLKGGLQGVVVGEVMECTPHPDADRLRVTRVDVGSGEWLQIVCGAPNVATGQKVAVATVGTVLYFTNGDEVKIKKSKLRGVESAGMICAEDELGLGNGHEGILVLDPAAAAGTPLRHLLNLENDTVFEIGLTPNRIDAASHIGVARDLAACLQVKINRPPVDHFSVTSGKGIPVKVENVDACPRYSGITIRNVTVRPSPEWLQKRLNAIGVRPVNNVVDITNFVLHEIGQPLHAFDADTIAGNEVIVRTCPEGTVFTTLDGVERKLSTQDLMICNASHPMCLAGVFGGLQHGVTERTTNLFLESAYFHPVWIRKTARRHGLNTDASFRYERGADPSITLWALKRAALLIQSVAGGEITGDIVDVYPVPIPPATVRLTYANMARLTGKDLGSAVIKRILEYLDFTIENEDATGLQVTVPTCRVDVTREADVVEELLRIYGYNNIDIPARTTIPIAHETIPDKERVQNILSDYLVANGFYEMMNNSLTKADYYKLLHTFPEHRAVSVLNPLSSDLNVMRQTLLFGALESVVRNVNRQRADLKLFEWGNCYAFDKAKDDGTLKAYTEQLRLGMVMTGFTSSRHWCRPQEPATFFHLKGYVEAILERAGIDSHTLTIHDAPADLYANGMQYLLNGKTVAVLGTVAKNILRMFDSKQDVFAAELSAELLFNAVKKHKTLFKELPKFPEVRRDLALVLDEQVTYAQLRDAAFNAEKKYLLQVNLFDVYRGDKLPSGKKQYALSFTLQSKEKTLTDQQIETIMIALLKTFERTFAATLR